MPYLSFTFLNSNDDQTFTVSDEIDVTINPIFSGAVNQNDVSPSIRCWQGSDGKGRVSITGSRGPTVNYDIDRDGDQVTY